MGRLSHDPCTNHFSHPHPLHLSNYLQSSHIITQYCSACHLQSSGYMYACNTCNFTLHLSCTQLPSLITHPSHPLHTLTLIPSPAYPTGAFNCDACGRDGHGFSYHCTTCTFDLHTTCAQNPLSVACQSHPHLLQLTFHSPYQTKGFSCDICRKIGANHWLYRCGPCEFDAHLECAMGNGQVAHQPHLQHNNSFPGAMNNQQIRPMSQGVYMHSQSMGATQVGYQQQAVVNNNALMNAMVQGFAEGAAQQVGQNFVQSVMGGGCAGGNNNCDPNGGGSGGGGDVNTVDFSGGDASSGLEF